MGTPDGEHGTPIVTSAEVPSTPPQTIEEMWAEDAKIVEAQQNGSPIPTIEKPKPAQDPHLYAAMVEAAKKSTIGTELTPQKPIDPEDLVVVPEFAPSTEPADTGPRFETPTQAPAETPQNQPVDFTSPEYLEGKHITVINAQPEK